MVFVEFEFGFTESVFVVMMDEATVMEGGTGGIKECAGDMLSKTVLLGNIKDGGGVPGPLVVLSWNMMSVADGYSSALWVRRTRDEFHVVSLIVFRIYSSRCGVGTRVGMI